jgi:tetratricopeptide (TPR) repeat protein
MLHRFLAWLGEMLLHTWVQAGEFLHFLWALVAGSWHSLTWGAQAATTWVIETLLDWWHEKNFRYLVGGLPALIVFAGVAVLGAMAIFRPIDELTREYRIGAWQAFEAGELAQAEIAFQRLTRLEDPPTESQFGLGLVVEQQGDKGRSAALIGPLAPRDRTGFPAAHVWRARQILAGSLLPPAALAEAEAHLLRALEKNAAYPMAQMLLARVYLETNRLEQAEPLVAAFGPTNPELMLHLARVCQARGEQARAAKELERAVSVLTQRMRERPDEPSFRFRLAEALTLQGKFADAAHILRQGAALFPREPFAMQLARVSVQWARAMGDAPAAGGLSRQQVVGPSIALVEELPDSSEKFIQLYRLYAALGDPQLAERQLLRLAQQAPELRVELARLYAQRGVPGKAIETAQAALEEFRGRLRLNPANNEARFLAADAALVLRDYPTAAILLGEGWEATRTRSFATALASVYVQWYDAESHTPRAGPDDRLDLLRQALVVDPWNVDALRRLLVLGRGDTAQAARARALVQNLLVQGEAPAIAHLYLGTDLIEQGKILAAQKHFEQAFQLDPQMPDVANKLAWALANSNPPQLARAFQLANSAVGRQPAQVSFRYTRGFILTRLMRWQEALRDLEFCLPAMKDNPTLHQMLAEVYEQIGQPEVAEKHRRLGAATPP